MNQSVYERKPHFKVTEVRDIRRTGRKPEEMTNLKGRQLVLKDHPIIILRGKLDSLSSAIIMAQIQGRQMGNQSYVRDLQEVLVFVRQILSSEYTGKKTTDFELLGLTAASLRERSHNPKKFFGHSHLLTSCEMGPLCAHHNSLRTQTRETEIAAVIAFKQSSGLNRRLDIIKALNRLSSLFYVMMFQFLPENFNPESSGI